MGKLMRIVQYAALVMDLIMKSKQLLREQVFMGSDLESIRMRTKFGTEIVITTGKWHPIMVKGRDIDYILVAIQQCQVKEGNLVQAKEGEEQK